MAEEGVAGEEGATPPPAAAATTAGAYMMMNSPWLTAAAVAVYASRAMWVKFRELGLTNRKRPERAQDIAEGLEVEEEEEEEDEIQFGLEPNAGGLYSGGGPLERCQTTSDA